jgi:hypothetical protein
MLAVTVTASGNLQHPMLIFKRQTSVKIDIREFQTCPKDCVDVYQPKAWMDETIMILWIDQLFIMRKNTNSPAIVPLLILNASLVHTIRSIVNCIHLFNIEK